MSIRASVLFFLLWPALSFAEPPDTTSRLEAAVQSEPTSVSAQEGSSDAAPAETPPAQAIPTPTFPAHAPLMAKPEAEGQGKKKRVPIVIFSEPDALLGFTASEPAVNAMARSLIAREHTSAWVSLGSAVVGGAAMGIGAAWIHCSTDASGAAKCAPNFGVMLGGCAAVIVGSLVASAIKPSAEDYGDLAQAWNETIDEAVIPETPLDPVSD